MKYSSLQEYFYKLQNILYLLVLFPLLVFIFFFVSETSRPAQVLEDQIIFVNIFLFALTLIDLSTGIFIFYRSLKAIRKIDSLGLRLERYYAITVLLFSLISFANLLLIAGYFLTGNLFYPGLFGLCLMVYLIIWPRSSRVCLHLKLKGTEREMVYYKKMNLY